MEQVRTAYDAVHTAIKALCKASPHGRDYYVQGDTATSEAIDEHISRLDRLRSVLAELEEIAVHLVSEV